MGTLVLVHGAGSGPAIFDAWRAELPDLSVVTPDLQGGLDVARASMGDYARGVASAIRDLRPPVVLCGWSMGGLVAALAARIEPAAGLVLIEPSPPAEVQGRDDSVEPVPGTFDPEEVYGAFPDWAEARPESSLARAERKRGISIPALPRPALVVFGDEFHDDRGRRLVELYGCEAAYFPGLDHWGLIADPRVRARVGDFTKKVCGSLPSHPGNP